LIDFVAASQSVIAGKDNMMDDFETLDDDIDADAVASVDVVVAAVE